MGDLAQKEAVASLLFEHVKNEDVVKIERGFSQFSQDSQWREIVRYEFPIEKLTEDTLRCDVVVPRLPAYEITSLSPFHYAAFKGLNEILVAFIEHDIPVDVTLNGGTTGIHLAAFTGKADTVRLLIEVYKADYDKQDKYGWTALHYASTEGHLQVVEVLLKAGSDVNLRDKDGTSAAFRAQVNGFVEIATLLCGGDDGDEDLLCVDPETDTTSGLTDGDLYSRICKSKTLHPKTPSSIMRDKSGLSLHNRKVQSQLVTSSEKAAAQATNQKSRTLPNRDPDKRKSSIRRLIQKELKAALVDEGEPGYMDPQDVTDADTDPFIGIGVNTLRGIMKEELGKVAKGMLGRTNSVDSHSLSRQVLPPSPPPPPPNYRSNVDYEDIYETVKALELSKPSADDQPDDIPEEAPPLPPRNPDMFPVQNSQIVSNHPTTTIPEHTPMALGTTLVPTGSSSALIRESIKRLSPILGQNWKKLAFALPLHANKEKVKERVAVIERRQPGDVDKQANMALVEWRINKGQGADVDDLIIALRHCGLDSLIAEVERVTQEFTA